MTSKAPFKSKIQFQRNKGHAGPSSFCPHHLVVLGVGHQRRKQTLLLSSPACKELRIRGLALTSEKLNKLNNQQLFLDLSERQGPRANCCPQTRRDRQVTTVNHNLLEQKLPSRNLCGNHCRVRKSQLKLANCWSLRVDTSEHQKF